MTGQRRLRLFLRDAAAAVAFASMAISGQLPAWLMLGFALGAVAAFAGLRLRSASPGNVVLVVGMVVLFGSVLRGRQDLVVAAATFAALLTVARMLAPPSKAADGHVHLVALLMVAGGAALSADITFALFLVTFAVLATSSMALGVLEESSRAAGEPPPMRAAFPRLALGMVAILGLAAAFFVFFPRLSWNMAARQGPTPLSQSTIGFTGELKLGGATGSLKTNPRPVLVAKLEPDPGSAQLDQYWHGRALDTFDGRSWTAAHRREPPEPRIDLGPPERGAITQEIELLPAYGSRTLVALEAPTGFAAVVNQRGPPEVRPRLIRLVDEQVRIPAGFSLVRYRAVSQPSRPMPLSDPELGRYRALPEDLDPRFAALAGRVLGDEDSPSAAAAKLSRFLKGSYGYSLDAPSQVPRDPLADFLFERKQGHCEHFATALAVLLRTRGFATRVVTGFYGGERIDDRYVVRAADAHAWVQVWVPDRGFVTFDATPDGFRAGRPSVILGWLARQYETLERLWRTQVVDYSWLDQERAAIGVIDSVQAKRAERARAPSGFPGWIALATVVGLALAFWSARRLPRRSVDPTARVGARLSRLLARASPPLGEDESLEDYLARLEAAAHPAAPALRRIFRRYFEARFGTRPLEPGEGRLLARLAHGAVKSPASRPEAPPPHL